MEKQKVIEMITEIGTCEDDATRRSMLADLQEGLTADYDSFAESTTKNEELTKKVSELQEHNMKLFLQIGSPGGGGDDKPDETPDETDKPKFEDLFDGKGGFK